MNDPDPKSRRRRTERKPIKVTSIPPHRLRNDQQVYAHEVEGDPGTRLLVAWDASAKGLVGKTVTEKQSRLLTAAVRDPYVVPVNGDQSSVWRCDWDPAINNYRCRMVPVGSPEARV